MKKYESYLRGLIMPRSSSRSRNSMITAKKYKRFPITLQILKPRFSLGTPGFGGSLKSSRICASSGVVLFLRFAISNNLVNF